VLARLNFPPAYEVWILKNVWRVEYSAFLMISLSASLRRLQRTTFYPITCRAGLLSSFTIKNCILPTHPKKTAITFLSNISLPNFIMEMWCIFHEAGIIFVTFTKRISCFRMVTIDLVPPPFCWAGGHRSCRLPYPQRRQGTRHFCAVHVITCKYATWRRVSLCINCPCSVRWPQGKC
jgi:hypothetical protein